jgi:RNA polymerase sigma-70 factor (ECF subfamily)
VLAQNYVNRYRSQRRLVSFDDQIQTGQLSQESAEAPADARLEAAVDAALVELPADARLILASYYLDGRTLAEIARMLGVHESTISRRVEKITASLRKRIVRGLRERGMDARAAEESLEADVRDLTLDVRARLQEKKG